MSVKYDITADNLLGNNYRPIHAGDDYTHRFRCNRGSGALDLTGAKLWLTVKEDALETDAESKLQLTSDETTEIEITDATNGEFAIKFSGGGTKKTEDLEGLWQYDIQAKLGDAGSTLITLCYGRIEFLPNITRSTS